MADFKGKEPFRKMHLDEEGKQQDVFTIRLNKEERELLDKCKKILEQSKDSTAFKQLANIGTNVIHDKLMGGILVTVFKNKQRNKRHGIVEFEQM